MLSQARDLPIGWAFVRRQLPVKAEILFPAGCARPERALLRDIRKPPACTQPLARLKARPRRSRAYRSADLPLSRLAHYRTQKIPTCHKETCRHSQAPMSSLMQYARHRRRRPVLPENGANALAEDAYGVSGVDLPSAGIL